MGPQVINIALCWQSACNNLFEQNSFRVWCEYREHVALAAQKFAAMYPWRQVR